MAQKPLTDMTERELLVTTAVRVQTIERDIKEIKLTIKKDHEPRIRDLEDRENERAGAEKENKGNNATAIALIALAISLIGTIGNIFM